MKSSVVVIGIGEIGSVIARGFLRLGHPVYPVIRSMDMEAEAIALPNPALVVLAVGESDLDILLPQIPEQWRSQLVLIQNELLPPDWQKHSYSDITIASIWFEKKSGQDVKVVVPTTLYGPHATLLSSALDALSIPNTLLESTEQLTFELLRKNYYILTSNIAGLKAPGTVANLWENHQDFARSVSDDIAKLQSHLLGGVTVDNQALIDAMVVAFEGDPEHQCMGRSAPIRLQRALDVAKSANIEVPVLFAIAEQMT
ncbi:MAG: hypothetical protein KAH22_00335 [Thiotrichaceae bacterium]|nr:hypothetical protein [Thiotrichaceae bacterium]